MSLNIPVVRITNIGVDQSGNPISSTIFIPDMDVGYEYQSRKTGCYVPYGANNAVVLPMTSRTIYSMKNGSIAKFLELGYITVETFTEDASGVLTPFPSSAYDLVGGSYGPYLSEEVIMRFISPRKLVVAGTPGSTNSTIHKFKCTTAPSTNLSFVVYKNSSVLMTVNWLANSLTYSNVVLASDLSVNVDDEISVKMPLASNATFDGVYYSIKASE
jgi:hypothetical protein